MAGQISWFFLLAFIGANLLMAFADIDKDTCGGICMKVVGKSGKVAIVRCGKGKKKDFGKADYGKAFTLGVDYIKQLDNDGKSVGKPLNSLASQDFNISALNSTGSYQGLKAAHLKLKAYLKDPKAWFHVMIYIFCEAGNITFGNETFEVQNGTLKFFMKLNNYTFCNGSKTDLCKKDEVGKFGEIALEVKSRKGKPPKRDDEGGDKGGDKKKKRKMKCHLKHKGSRCPRNFKFGDDEDADEMVAATQCEHDGKFVNMSGDFPKVETQGIKYRLLFRVPRFSDSVFIDPGVSLSESDDDDGGEPGEPTEPSEASSIQLNIFMLVVMVTTLFMFM